MASIKKLKANKDFMLDCGHAVRAGEEFVIASVFTCQADSASAGELLKRRTHGKSWGELIRRSIFG